MAKKSPEILPGLKLRFHFIKNYLIALFPGFAFTMLIRYLQKASIPELHLKFFSIDIADIDVGKNIGTTLEIVSGLGFWEYVCVTQAGLLN